MNTPPPRKPKHALLKKAAWGLVGWEVLRAIAHRHRAREGGAPDGPDGHGSTAATRREPEVKPLRTLLGAFVGLQVLLALTVGSAFIDFGGAANTAINLTISVLMMLLLMTLFMHESAARRLTQLASATGILWIILMIGLTLADYLTRVHIPAPWH